MKKFPWIICVAVMTVCLLFMFSAQAHAAEIIDSGTCGENLTWSIDSDLGVLTIEGRGDMQYFLYDAPWLEYKSYVKEIVIKDGVTSISSSAFEEMTATKAVTIPPSIATVEKHAFFGCTELEMVHISNLTKWCEIAFASYTANPVYYASNLYLNGKPLDKLVVPSDITTLGYVQFANCDTLVSVEIPYGVNEIKDGTFDGCSRLVNITIPESITAIGERAFSSCSSLTNISLPSDITTIDAYAFSSCRALESIRIPNKVTTIEKNAFYYCKNMKSVLLPDSLRLIESDAFEYCPLQHVLYKGTEAQWAEVSIAKFNSEINNAGIICNAREDMPGEHTYGDWTMLDNYEHEQVCTLCRNATIKSHRWNSGEIMEQPTCVKAGVKIYICYVCMGTKTESVPKLNMHTYDKKVTKPTCTAKGYTTYTCSCGDTYKDNYVNVTSHSYAAATCTKPKTCKVCKATSGKVLGHSYKSGSCTRCKHKPAGAKITTQPVNVAVKSGKTAKVTVKATGTGLKYTWYYAKKGSSSYTKTTVTSSSYSVKMSSSVNGGKVYCVVSDAYGNSVKSNVVTLYKGTPAKITTQPKGMTVASGKTGKLTIKASGSSLKYQWYIKYKGASSFTKVGKSSKTYSFKMASKLNGAQVYCVVKDKYGIEVKSSVVTIKMPVQPKITAQPKSVKAFSGKTVKFTVKASGDGLKYQWYYAKKGSSKFKKLSTKSATYSVKVSSSVDGRRYYCVVTDKYGQTVKTSVVTLTMQKNAKITTQPKNVSVKNNKTAKVTIKATGDGLKYTWYYLLNGQTKYQKATVTGNTFSVKMAAKYKNCKVYCMVSDQYGNSVKSKTVTLKMK